MTLHAKLSASGAHRWMNCPGSVAAEDGIPDRTSSFAAEGTLAHDIVERALRLGVNCDTICDRPDMAEPAQVYVDYVRALPGQHRFIETRVSFEEWVPGGFGTADIIVIDESTGTLHISDLKFGKGVRVDAEHNPQALLYALGACNAFGFVHEIERVKIAIIQPRIDHISEWEITITDLLKWGEIARTAAEETTKVNAPRVPGDKQCRFCKAKGDCPALYNMTQKAILSEFEDLAPSPINKLSDEQLRAALEAKPLIEAWLSAVEQLVTQRIADGGEFAGFKIVEGRSLRQWNDDESLPVTLERILGERAYTKKMISPAQAEKLLGRANKAAVEKFIVKPRGKPALAKENDPRPSITISVSDFDSGEETEE